MNQISKSHWNRVGIDSINISYKFLLILIVRYFNTYLVVPDMVVLVLPVRLNALAGLLIRQGALTSFQSGTPPSH